MNPPTVVVIVEAYDHDLTIVTVLDVFGCIESRARPFGQLQK